MCRAALPQRSSYQFSILPEPLFSQTANCPGFHNCKLFLRLEE
jgi:hypothetical protein